ncbi:hypothetical protein ACJX0J_009767 [Zea mays]
MIVGLFPTVVCPWTILTSEVHIHIIQFNMCHISNTFIKAQEYHQTFMNELKGLKILENKFLDIFLLIKEGKLESGMVDIPLFYLIVIFNMQDSKQDVLPIWIHHIWYDMYIIANMYQSNPSEIWKRNKLEKPSMSQR